MQLSPLHLELLRPAIAALPPDAPVAFCGAGAFLEQNEAALRKLLGNRRVVAILDDDRAKQHAGRHDGTPIRPVNHRVTHTLAAVIITTDRAEDALAERLRQLHPPPARLIRTARVELNQALSPQHVREIAATPIPATASQPPPHAPARPLTVGVEISNACNLNCRMCETKASQRPTGAMSVPAFDRALDALERAGLREILYHTVGEPTAHKHFAEILQRSAERGFSVFLSTNGTLLENWWDALRRWPPARLRFSIDGATAKTFEHIRVGARFNTVLQNLRRAAELIRTAALPTKLAIDVTLSRDNLHEVPLFFDLFGPLVGDNNIHFHPLNALAADGAAYYETVRLLEKSAPLVPCAGLWEGLYVGYDGRVSACCRDYHGELVVGDLARESLQHIWEGAALAQLRDAHRAQNLAALPNSCRTCLAPDAEHTLLLQTMIAALRRSRVDQPTFVRELEHFIATLNADTCAATPGGA